MLRELLVPSFAIAGALASFLVGRILGQVLVDRDEAGCPGTVAAAAVAAGLLSAAVGWTQFQAFGFVAFVLALPAYRLFCKINDLEEVLPQPTRQKSEEEIRRETLNSWRWMCSILGLFCGAYSVAAGTHYWGIGGGLLCIALNPLTTLLATGAVVMVWLTVDGIVFVAIRTVGKTDELSKVISAKLRCPRR